MAKMLPILLANFTPFTWVAMLFLSYHVLMKFSGAILPLFADLTAITAFAYLLMRFLQGVLVNLKAIRNPYLPTNFIRKMTGVVCDAQGNLPTKPGGNKLVVFVVGSSQNHPFGVFAPDVRYVGRRFDAMWEELETNREKWGFLGRTDVMVSQRPNRGNNLVYISYWRSMEDLHRFNLSPLHMDVRRWWNANLRDMPHLGIFHETYSVEPHNWETIYENFHPMGLGQTQVPVMDPNGNTVLVNALMPAQGTTMHSRMNRSQEGGF